MTQSLLSRIGFGALPVMLALSGCADAGDETELAGGTSALDTATTAATTTTTTLTIKQGKLAGKIVGTTREFLGIPYAKAPVGALRFAPPVAAAGWSGTRAATDFGPVCPQNPGGLSAPGTQSEDCLTINVYTPKGASGLPVMVFIHGGAFIAGGSTSYDPQLLSEANKVVVVTFNYRLGALGFLSLPELDAKRGTSPSGNDALRDQQLALTWVKNNIGTFGGSASNVTLFGESAGSMSTCVQMVSPTSRTLAKRFLMESATCVAGLPINTKDQSNKIGAGLASAFCAGATDVVSCLRAVPAADLIAWGKDAGISGAGWAPTVNANDPLLPKHPTAMIKAGDYNKGTLIVGSNAREWGLFQLLGAAPSPASVVALNAIIDGTFGPIAAYVKNQYSTTATDATANATYVRLMTDYLFRCPARKLARLTTAQGSTAYLYSFEEGAAYHAFELPYVFNKPNPNLGTPTLVEPLRTYVQAGLGNFAKSGNPNGSGATYWPAYATSTDQHAVLIANPTTGSGLANSDCNFWAYIDSLSGN